jgi:phosphoserine aminotransferase
MIENNSMLNTGPTFAIYVIKEFTKFLVETGGIDVWEKLT